MLVLTRRCHERIVVKHAGGSLRIEVWKDRHGKIRVALEAPSDFEIIREEIAAQIAAEVETR
jgi:carbon storage regulator CsrA